MLLTLAFLQNIGSMELVLICVVALIVFGNKFPEVARNVGKALTQFKSGLQEASTQVRREIEQAAAEADPTPEIKSAIGDSLTSDTDYKPNDYTSTDHPDEYHPYNYDGSQTPAAADAATGQTPPTLEGSSSESAAEAGSPEGQGSEQQVASTSASGMPDADVSQATVAVNEPPADSTSGAEGPPPTETPALSSEAASAAPDKASTEVSAERSASAAEGEEYPAGSSSAETKPVAEAPKLPVSRNPDAALLN